MAKKMWTSWRTHLSNLSELNEITVKEYIQLFSLNRNAVQVAFLKLRRMKLVDCEKKIFHIQRKKSSTPSYYHTYRINEKGWKAIEYYENKLKSLELKNK